MGVHQSGLQISVSSFPRLICVYPSVTLLYGNNRRQWLYHLVRTKGLQISTFSSFFIKRHLMRALTIQGHETQTRESSGHFRGELPLTNWKRVIRVICCSPDQLLFKCQKMEVPTQGVETFDKMSMPNIFLKYPFFWLRHTFSFTIVGNTLFIITSLSFYLRHFFLVKCYDITIC